MYMKSPELAAEIAAFKVKNGEDIDPVPATVPTTEPVVLYMSFASLTVASYTDCSI